MGGSIPAALAPLFVAAGRKYHIDPSVLAGVASVETNLGADRSTSSAGAVGLMQFEPGTAAGLHIDPLNDQQAIDGAAQLLNQYGYQQNATRAIGAYNGGPGNPQYSYASQVLSEAKRLGGQLTGVGAGTTTAITATAGAGAAGGDLFGAHHSQFLYATVFAGVLALGAWLLFRGLNSTTGGAVDRAVHTAGTAARAAAA